MTNDSTKPSGERGKSPTPGIGTLIWIVVLVVVLFVLAHTMVHHRFHRGGRANPNGTIGP
jgi:fatty acid desaturase